MRRRSLFLASVVLALTGLATVETGCSKPQPHQTEVTTSLSGVKDSIASVTGYDASALEVAVTGSQLMIKVINSPLAARSAAERQNEAQRIAAAVSSSIGGKSEFSSLNGIHVDYVTRENDGSGARVVDGIDFRKDPAGVFQHHIT